MSQSPTGQEYVESGCRNTLSLARLPMRVEGGQGGEPQHKGHHSHPFPWRSHRTGLFAAAEIGAGGGGLQGQGA